MDNVKFLVEVYSHGVTGEGEATFTSAVLYGLDFRVANLPFPKEGSTPPQNRIYVAVASAVETEKGKENKIRSVCQSRTGLFTCHSYGGLFQHRLAKNPSCQVSKRPLKMGETRDKTPQLCDLKSERCKVKPLTLKQVQGMIS